MHIPDGFLSPPVFISGWAVALGTLSYALKKTKKILKDKMIPLMGVMAAFIFAAQMLNFPVLGGTSGHLLGGVLAGVTLGPYAGCIVLSIVLIVQCLIFQDGGLTTLGTNILNMAVAGTIACYYLYALLNKFIFKKSMLVAVFIASWFSVVLASISCAFELAISGTSPLRIVLPAMVFVHIFIGIGEAIITTLVLSFILKVRPDLVWGYKR
jgi:cobalt/nickel transport system permease protein